MINPTSLTVVGDDAHDGALVGLLLLLEQDGEVDSLLLRAMDLGFGVKLGIRCRWGDPMKTAMSGMLPCVRELRNSQFDGLTWLCLAAAAA